MTETSPLIDAINKHWDDPRSVIRVVGLAGVGKTYALAEAMSYVHSVKGSPLTRIVFVSFTRAAIQEVRHKIKGILKNSSYKTGGEKATSFATAQIATIHSWCWQHLLQESKEYIKSVGFYSPEQYGLERGLDEELSKAMSRYFSLKALGQHDEAESKMFEHLNSGALMYHLEDYVTQKGEKIDYNDILAMALQAEAYDKPIDLLLVDESQDLTEVQWEIVVKHLWPNARVTVVAGDLTQSIYLWNGAVPDMWMGSTVDTEIFMDESRRIPADLLPLVNSCIPDEQYWIRTHPSNKNTGRIRISSEIEVLEYLYEKSMKNEEALVLTLSNFFVRMISNIFIQNGILFSRSDSYGREGFSQIITLQDWSALKLYGAMMQGDLSMEFFKADIGRMLRRSNKFTKKWRAVNNIQAGLGGRGEGSTRWFNERHGHEVITLEELAPLIDLTPGEFFDDCFAVHKGEDLFYTKRYFSMDEYYHRCYQGPYIEPKIKLSTVHGAKGLESSCVALFVYPDKRWSDDERLKLYLNAICRSSSEIIITGEPDLLIGGLLGKAAPDEWLGSL